MKMLINILDAESERRHGEKAVAVAEEFAVMKQDFIFACGHAGALGYGMIEHAVGAEPSIGDAQPLRIDPPNLDAQPLRGPSACHINRVNGNTACHLAVPPVSAPPW